MFRIKNIPFLWVDTNDFMGAIQVIIDKVFEFNQREYKQHPDRYIQNHGLNIFIYTDFTGFEGIDKPFKSKSTNLPIELLSLRAGAYPPAIYIVRDIEEYINNYGHKINDALRCIYSEMINQDKKLILIGDISKLAIDVKSLFVPYNLNKEIEKLKKEIAKENVNTQIYTYSQILSINELRKNPFENLTKFCEEVESEIDFTHLGGVEEIENFGNIFKKTKKYKPKTLLVLGKSGVGKTASVKALAKKLKMKLYRVDFGKIFNLYVGETEKNIRELWDEMEKLSPAIFLFDEIEKLLAGIGSSNESDAGTTARVLGYLLYQLQEKKIEGSLIVGTVNYPDILPPEFFREGRWDMKITIHITNDYTKDVVKKIIKRYTNINKMKKINLKELVKLFEHKSGAYIENKILSALRNMEAHEIKITEENLIEEVKDAIQIS